MTAASSIHGAGAQNLARAMRSGRIAVSGIAFGPYLVSFVRASSLVRPLDGLSSTLTCAAFVGMDGLAVVGGIVSQTLSNRDIYKRKLILPSGGMRYCPLRYTGPPRSDAPGLRCAEWNRFQSRSERGFLGGPHKGVAGGSFRNRSTSRPPEPAALEGEKHRGFRGL